MHLAVTIKRDENLEDIRELILAVQKSAASGKVIVREAPLGLEYPYSFPIVTVADGPDEGRHYGADAVDILRKLSKAA